MRWYTIITAAAVLAACASLAARDGKNVEPAPGADVVKDWVKGSIHHHPQGEQVEYQRSTGKALIVGPTALRLSDGTHIDLGQAPDLSENQTKLAMGFLRQLIGDRPVTSFGYVAETNIQHAMIINGWG